LPGTLLGEGQTLRQIMVAIAMATVLATLCSRADASLLITIDQVGSNVVATGSGSLDLTDLSEGIPGSIDFGIVGANNGVLVVGPQFLGVVDVYTGISGPSSFGGGSGHQASSGSGGPLGVFGGAPELFVPTAYVSGSALSGTATWDAATIDSLGLTRGIYTYTWGTGAHTDRLTINIGAVPEPSTLVLSSIAAIAGLGAWARKRVDRRADGACGPASLM
jgi:hypothetical protein